MKTVRFLDQDCSVVLANYSSNGRIAIMLLCEDGSPMTTATSCIDHPMPEGCTAIKTYSENEGILEALVEAGIVRETGHTATNGFAKFPIVEVLVKHLT